jgi:hypothetical protein
MHPCAKAAGASCGHFVDECRTSCGQDCTCGATSWNRRIAEIDAVNIGEYIRLDSRQ